MVRRGQFFISIFGLLALALFVSGCSGGNGDGAPTTPTPVPSPPSTTQATTCFSFSPSRAQASSNPQRLTIQVTTAETSCSWTATDATNWIDIVRTGSLFQQGNGILAFDIEGNKDERFGGCPTTPRTGRITVTEEGTGREGVLEVVQQGATEPFQPPAACTVAQISYGTTTAGSLAGSDCTVSDAPTKYYTFQGFSGQGISISMTAGRFVSGGLKVPSIRLYGPSSGFITGVAGNVVVDDPRFTRNLSCGGTYTLEVTSTISSVFNPAGLGNYILRLQSQN